MKALIIGAAGFVGSYLAEYLKKDCGWDVFATKLEQESFCMEGVAVYDLDILDGEAVQRLLTVIEPDFIFHLAAQSSVALSWKNPDLTVDVNIKGCIHILEAVRKRKKQPRILLVGSGEEYGREEIGTLSKRELLLENEKFLEVLEDGRFSSEGESFLGDGFLKRERFSEGKGLAEEGFLEKEWFSEEERVLHPQNIYAVTKACQNMLGTIYAKAYQMEVILVRAFNHIGPGQASVFVVSDFCRQVAEIEAGKREPVLLVGNLAVKRDFTDVRDVVRAYGLLIEKGKSGETYNVGSGKAVAIQDVLEKILQLSKKEIRVECDPSKIRPIDQPVVEADIRKLQKATGWKPRISLEDTLKDILEDWRKRVE